MRDVLTPLDKIAPCLCGCVWLQHQGGKCRCGRCLWFRLDNQIWPIGELVCS